MFDVLIKGGRIVDGSGNPWFYGSIGVQGDRVKILRGDTSSIQTARVIDASGCIVCPGFIDSHSHSDVLALSNPLHEPKIMQGVTTDLIGVDGMGYAPLSKSNLEMMKIYWSGLSGNPELSCEWSSVAEYLRCFYHSTSINIGFFIPNGAVRLEVIGWDDRPASKEEIRQMQAMVRRGMEEGALGLSSGLGYPASVWADTCELVELCKVVSELGGVYTTHVRYHKGDGIFDGFREAVEIGRQSGVAVNISHFFLGLNARGRLDELLEIIDEARDSGVDITFDSYPYEHGVSPLTLRVIPTWAHLGGPYDMLKRLGSKTERAKMREDNRVLWHDWEDWNHRNYISAVGSEKNKWCEGLTPQEIADRLGKDVMDVVCDLLIEENLLVNYTGSRQYPGSEETVKAIMKHPAGMLVSDGVLIGGMPHPRTYGAFPKVLRWLVREQKVLTLEEAINRMTFFPAKRYGLSDRGILQDGIKADIVVFDPDRVADKSTYTEPKQYPVGIEYIFVNGKLVVEKGKHTGATPGEPLHKVGV